jgi:hypothetical protein
MNRRKRRSSWVPRQMVFSQHNRNPTPLHRWRRMQWYGLCSGRAGGIACPRSIHIAGFFRAAIRHNGSARVSEIPPRARPQVSRTHPETCSRAA